MATSPALEKTLEIYFTHHQSEQKIKALWKGAQNMPKLGHREKDCIFRKGILSSSSIYVIATHLKL